MKINFYLAPKSTWYSVIVHCNMKFWWYIADQQGHKSCLIICCIYERNHHNYGIVSIIVLVYHLYHFTFKRIVAKFTYIFMDDYDWFVGTHGIITKYQTYEIPRSSWYLARDLKREGNTEHNPKEVGGDTSRVITQAL